MRGWAASLAVALALAGASSLAAPETSPRPEARTAPLAEAGTARALPRGVAAPGAPRLSLRPAARPDLVTRRAVARRAALARGAVCGDPALQGEPAGRIAGRIAGCGLDGAVQVRAVSGVRLSQPSIMDCTTARMLKQWVERGMKPALGSRGGGVTEIVVLAHYACRTRNNRPGARLSEHAKGRAIDIAGFRLRDGGMVTVLEGWGRGRDGRALAAMHRAACGPFGTVLGPNSDRYHRNHFHFDTARHRGGAYCR
ncbi:MULTISPECIES: extensin family protein [unclassified Rhodosalinus]|uniref:extensin-like domain-containing protein n=1 Tax=unclassified Rhodosalinus TaxID=2630183 RepID=UPI0035262691